MGCGGSKSNPDQKKQKFKDEDNILDQQYVEDPNQKQFYSVNSKKRESVADPTNAASVENINKFYQFGQILGHGAYGTVRQASLTINKSKKFAVQTIIQSAAAKKLYLLRRELEILKSLDHPNIIKFYEIYHDQMYVHFVMQYCEGGDLYNKLINEDIVKEQEASRIMKKLFSAVAYIHQFNIAHRDIKPANILLTKIDNNQLKLIDFGLAQQFPKKEALDRPSVVGTPLYTAPQVIEETVYDKKCDVWSLGVVLYQMLSGLLPFYSNESQELYEKIQKADFSLIGDKWKNISADAKDLIRQMLQKNPRQRIDCEEAMKHPWCNQNFQEQKRNLQHNSEIMQVSVGQAIKNFEGSIILDNVQGAMLQKEAVKILINHHLKNDQIQNLKMAFQALDKDGKGQLNYENFQEAITTLGLESCRKNIEEYFKVLSQGDQTPSSQKVTINYGEFIAATLDLKKVLNEQNLWAMFQQFDSGSKGYINKQDLRDSMARNGTRIDEKQLNLIFESIEKGIKDSGQITFEQFQLIMVQEDLQIQYLDDGIMSPKITQKL